jgi:hypothetical protein
MAAAFCHIVCERPAEAIKALDQLLVAAPPGFAGWTIPIEPFFTALRAEPSFQAVLSRLSERARIALTLFHPFFTLPSRLQRVRSPILFS